MGYCMETGKHECSHLLDAFWTFEIGPITWLCQRVKKIQVSDCRIPSEMSEASVPSFRQALEVHRHLARQDTAKLLIPLTAVMIKAVYEYLDWRICTASHLTDPF